MRVTINGEEKNIAATHIESLLSELDYEGRHYAVAINHDVVPRARWAETPIRDGDAVEILSPRQGG